MLEIAVLWPHLMRDVPVRDVPVRDVPLRDVPLRDVYNVRDVPALQGRTGVRTH